MHLSLTDTDITGSDVPENAPADVVRAALAGVERGDFEILADDETRAIRNHLSATPKDLYAGFLTVAR